MIKESTIAQRLSNAKMSIVEIARLTGLPKESLYKWKKGTIPLDTDAFRILEDFLDELEQLGKTGIVCFGKPLSTLVPKTLTMRLPLTNNERPIYNMSYTEKPGTVIMVGDEPQLIVEHVYAPHLGDIEGAVEVLSDNMYPTLSRGNRIGIKRLADPRIIHWGKCYYIIDKNHEGAVKRVFAAAKDSIKLVSDNPDQFVYPPDIWNRDQIITICAVKARLEKW